MPPPQSPASLTPTRARLGTGRTCLLEHRRAWRHSGGVRSRCELPSSSLESDMSLNQSLRWVVVAGFVLLSSLPVLRAQPGAFGGGYGPPLQVVPPAKAFATSDEHFKFLRDQAKGGTKHTLASVPRWDGLWVTAGNTHMNMFI